MKQTLEAEQMHKMTYISLKMVEVAVSFCQLLNLLQQLVSSQLDISHVLNGTTPEI